MLDRVTPGISGRVRVCERAVGDKELIRRMRVVVARMLTGVLCRVGLLKVRWP